MKILLAAYGWENLGVGYLAALAAREGHKVELLFDDGLFSDHIALSLGKLRRFFDPWPQMRQTILREKPDLIGINIFSSGYRWAREMARRIRLTSPNTVIIGGGPHATVAPGIVLAKENEFDAVIVGEGETAWLELLRNFDGQGTLPNDIKGLWVKDASGQISENGWSDLVENLDTLPFPDKKIFAPYFPHGKTYGIITSRGCPYACSFCQNNTFKREYGKLWSKVRHRSPENVIEELQQAVREYNFESVHFIDDCFTSDKKWLERFLRLYRSEIALPFRCINHPAAVDEKRIKLLKDAGCHSVVIGVQDWKAEVRSSLYGRRERDEQIRNAFDWAENAELHSIANHICGNPDENIADLALAASNYAELGVSRIATFHLTYFLGTDISSTAYERGWLNSRQFEQICEGDFRSYHEGGSITSERQLKNTRGFELLMHMFPIMPKKLRRKLANVESIAVLSYFPSIILRLADLGTTLATRDSEAMLYIEYYRHNIKRRINEAIEHRLGGRKQ